MFLLPTIILDTSGKERDFENCILGSLRLKGSHKSADSLASAGPGRDLNEQDNFDISDIAAQPFAIVGSLYLAMRSSSAGQHKLKIPPNRKHSNSIKTTGDLSHLRVPGSRYIRDYTAVDGARTV